MTKEMAQWLADNRDTYAFYLLHAMFHDPLMRVNMLGVPVTLEDFLEQPAEYELVIGALANAVKIANHLGKQVPTPPSYEYLRTYLEVAARTESSDDETVEKAAKLIRELQDPVYTEQHYCIRPYFEAWYGGIRAKRAARRIQRYVVPDVHGQIGEMQRALFAARQFAGGLTAHEFDFYNEPEEPEPILTLGEYTICTRGNISNIQGPPKSAKSAVVGAVLAAMIREPWKGNLQDTLGFGSETNGSSAVAHFDTEQSINDHHALVLRSYKRADRKAPAPWLYSYCLTGQEPGACWDFLESKLNDIDMKHHGIRLIIIDGIADFCRDPNDAEECFELVRKLQRLALDYNCVILTVLHENPNSGSGKTRGHLGSQLERKAETSLRLAKNLKTGVVEMWTERSRHCFIPKSAGLRFEWCDKRKMHVSLWKESEDTTSYETAKTKGDKKTNQYKGELSKAFAGNDLLTFAQLLAQLMKVTRYAQPTLKQRISEYLKMGLVEKNDEGKYRLISHQ